MTETLNVTGDGYIYNHQDAAVARFIGEYRPRQAGNWADLGPLVRDLVADTRPKSQKVAQPMLKVTYEFLLWIRDVAAEDVDPTAFTARNMRRFLEQRPDRGSSMQSLHEAKMLSRVVGAVTGFRPPTHQRDRGDARPYRADEVAALWSAAQTLRTPRLRETTCRIIALGLGAGLTLTEMEWLRVEDIEPGFVRTPRRTVPVLHRWQRDLTVSSRSAGGFYLLPAVGRIAGKSHALSNFLGDLGSVHPSAPRLRSTWIVELLTGDVPANVAMHLAGMTTFTAFDRYKQWLTPPSEQDVTVAMNRLGGLR